MSLLYNPQYGNPDCEDPQQGNPCCGDPQCCSWCLLVAPGCSWWLLVAPGGSWLLLVAPGGSWYIPHVRLRAGAGRVKYQTRVANMLSSRAQILSGGGKSVLFMCFDLFKT